MLLQKRQENCPSHSHFLSLPRELRDQIYHELLLEDLVWDGPRDRYDLQPAILRANKQISEEGSRVLYEENCWVMLEIDCNKDYMDILEGDQSHAVSSKHLEDFPRRTFLRVEVKELLLVMNPIIHLLATTERLRGICKNFTSASSSTLLEVNLFFFNLSGRRREQLLDSALDAVQETRGIGAVCALGTEPVSKGNELAFFMMTSIENAQEIVLRSNVYESRGDQLINAKQFQGALREYLLGYKYLERATYFVEDMEKKNVSGFNDTSEDLLKKKLSAFICSIAFCFMMCERTAEASNVLVTAISNGFMEDSEKLMACYYLGWALLIQGINREAIRNFILALRWCTGVEASNVEIDALEAHLEGDPHAEKNAMSYYNRFNGIYQTQKVHMARQQSPIRTGVGIPAVLHRHIQNESRETETMSVS